MFSLRIGAGRADHLWGADARRRGTCRTRRVRLGWVLRLSRSADCVLPGLRISMGRWYLTSPTAVPSFPPLEGARLASHPAHRRFFARPRQSGCACHAQCRSHRYGLGRIGGRAPLEITPSRRAYLADLVPARGATFPDPSRTSLTCPESSGHVVHKSTDYESHTSRPENVGWYNRPATVPYRQKLSTE